VSKVHKYKMRRFFKPYHNRTQRFAIIVAHRRAGKTVASLFDLIKRAGDAGLSDGRYAYVAPYAVQAQHIAWDYLKRYARPVLRNAFETELSVRLKSHARIFLYGADNPDRLRGTYLDGVVLDEFADIRPGVWSEVIRPMLADRKGFATFIGTPKGKNEFFRLWTRAQKDPAWFAQMLKASDTGIVAPDELAAMRADMSKDEYEQEMQCSFDAAIRGAIYAEELRRAAEQGRIRRIAIDKAVPVHTAWDLGVSESTAIWFIQCVGRERRLVDYYESSGIALPDYVQVLEEKKQQYGWSYGEHYLPHDIMHLELSNARSRIETLRLLGVEPIVVEQHHVLDGVNAVRRMLDRTYIDIERCAHGLEALKAYRRDFDERNNDWKASPRHDWASHGADALRTFAAGFEDKPASRPAGSATPPSPWAA